MGNEVRVRITGDDSGLQSALKGVAASEGLRNLREGLGSLKTALEAPIQNASALGESVNAVNVMFGKSSDKILEFGKIAAGETGLAARDFNQMAAQLSASLTNTGLPMDQVADKTIEVSKRAADLASVFNTDVDEALVALRSGLNGETEPLRRFGVNLTAAAVEQKALAMTGKEAASSLTDEEKALARLEFIMESTNKVQGDFKNTSDGLANAQRVLNAELENSRNEAFGKLLPVVEQSVLLFSALPAEVQVLSAEMLNLGPALGQTALGLKLLGPQILGVAKALPALSAALLTPPLGIVVALVAVGVAAYVFRDEIVGAFQSVLDKALPILESIRDTIIGAFNTVLEFAKEHWPEIAVVLAGPFAPMVALATDAFGIRSALTNALMAIIGFAREHWPEIATVLSGPFAPVVALATDAFGIRSAFTGALSALVGEVKSLGEDIVNGLWEGIESKKDWLFGKIEGLATGIENAIRNPLGIFSPSKVFARIGGDIVDGLVGGIEMALPKLNRVLTRMVDTVGEASNAMVQSGLRPWRETWEGALFGHIVDPIQKAADLLNSNTQVQDYFREMDVSAREATQAVAETGKELENLGQIILGLPTPNIPTPNIPGTSSSSTSGGTSSSGEQTLQDGGSAVPQTSNQAPLNSVSLFGSGGPSGGNMQGVTRTMHRGGVVPGRAGSEQLILAEAGETVIPRTGRQSGGLTVIVHVHGHVLQAERDISRIVRDQILGGGFAGVLQGA